ncbi:hypothetical protein [Rivularia sp. UHCC 0363]|uniref:hypothetical protein n=1 Tax=Rivularia sp. UHCC 0363 TaxID=3110244 RepID=UPI002B1F0009|nr:hypothetical protein [Rivularia sp. UHCC 0363]MEA5596393.1 hypothetical protein [Rivularia sp. UHCC 0363]
MFKNAKAQPYFLGLGIAIAFIGAVATPASAQSVIIINGGNSDYGRQHPTVGNFIYGSPIFTPVPVNPATGQIPTQSYFSQPYTTRIYNPTYINPVLVNPTMIKSPRNQRRYYRNLRRQGYQQPGSRIIINSPW